MRDSDTSDQYDPVADTAKEFLLNRNDWSRRWASKHVRREMNAPVTWGLGREPVMVGSFEVGEDRMELHSDPELLQDGVTFQARIFHRSSFKEAIDLDSDLLKPAMAEALRFCQHFGE